MKLFQYSRHIIFAIALVTGLSLVPIPGLDFDFDIESFFPAGDPDREFFAEFQERFYTSIDDEYIFVGLKNEAGIFDQAFLRKVDSLSRFIAVQENILSVYSITNIPFVRFEDGVMIRDTLIHLEQPERYPADSVNLFNSGEYSLMLSTDGRSTAITALNMPGLSDAEKDRLITGIEQLAGQLGFDKWHVTAKIKLERTYIREIQSNLSRYLAVSLLLIAVVLAVTYRSVPGLILPMIIIAVSLIWTLGLIALTGRPLDIMSSLLPPVLAVIAMSDIIHITNKYHEELRSGKSRRAALTNTIKETGMATLFTSLTTAAGFYSLCVSKVLPIRFFGFFAGTGVILAFAAALGILLTVFFHTSRLTISPRRTFNDWWHNTLSACESKVSAGKWRVTAAFALLLIPAIFLIGKIEINSSLLMELPRDHSIRDDYAFMEEEFSGTRSFEMALMLNDTNSSFLDLAILGQVEELEAYLRDSLGVGNVFSPATFIKGAYRALSGGDIAEFKLPGYQADVYTCFDRLLLSPLGGDMIRFITQDERHARIGGKLPNLTIKEFDALDTRFERYFASREDNFGFDYKMTGSALLIDKVSYSLVRSLFTGLAIGFMVISLIVFGMFRSVKMVGIVLMANIIPLVLMASAMGALGIYLKADTAIIFAISFGIVVDDSIHFISRFRMERLKGLSVREAVRATYLSTGKAMILTTILLLAGFVSLTFSSFGGTYYIGLLVSLCLLIALIIDLTLLPALILLFTRD